MLPCQYYNTWGFSENGLAAVKNEEGLWGYINEEGKEEIPCQYNDTDVNGFGENGLVAVQNEEGLWGYINEKGEEVIPCQYNDARRFSKNGLAAVENEEELWGYINGKGEEVILCQYVYAESFGKENGLAAVSYEGVYEGSFGLINEYGDEVTEFIYGCILNLTE